MTNESPSLREVSELEFVVEHTIRSSPDRIFEAYTKPELIARWWAQPGQALRVDEMEVRPGGKWRFAHALGGGEEMVMHGEYREVKPVTRLSYTLNRGEGTENEILAIVELEPVEAGTHLKLTSRCASREQRDAMVSYGAEQGAKAAWARLAALLRGGLIMPGKVEPESPSELIEARIRELGDWRGETLARVRALIKQADPEVVEEVKWRKPSNPMGVPVWSHDGIICTGEAYTDKVKFTFAKGAALKDPAGLFNASLEGNTRRAIDLHEGDEIDEGAFKALVRAAAALNASFARD